MKTNITLLASLLFAAAIAGPASAAPDFVGETHRPNKLAASDARQLILPQDDVAFGFNSAALLDSSHQQIATIARWLKANPRLNIVLEGHTDSTGDAAYNEDLSARRADMVRQHLIGHGIKSDRILTLVFGEAQAKPVASPIDRRVVVFATSERVETVAQRELSAYRAVHAMYTKNGVQFTETHGVTPGALATR